MKAEKSSFTILKSSRKKVQNLPDHIVFLDKQLKRSTHIEFLGIKLEDNLTRSQHINEVVDKLKSCFAYFIILEIILQKKIIKKTSIILRFIQG